MSDFRSSKLEVSCPSCNKMFALANINAHLDICLGHDELTENDISNITSGGFNETNNSFDNKNNYNELSRDKDENNNDESCSNNSDDDYWGLNSNNNNNNDNNNNKESFQNYNNDIYKRDYNNENDDIKFNDFDANFEDNSNKKFTDNKYNNLFGNCNINNNNDNTTTIVAIGKTGSGKSTLLNRLRGDTSNKGDKGPYKAKGGEKSVTQVVQSTTRQFNFQQNELKFFNNILCTLIDTPGLADSGGNEEKLVNEVRRFFQQVCTGVHVFIITFNVTNVRYDTNIQNLLHLLTQLFGKEFWRHVMIVFTRHDIYSNHKVHNDEYEDCMSQYPQKIKKQFDLDFKICSTGIGKNNYVKAIQDILKFSKNRGIFKCQYMKSWKEAGGIGNPKQRKQKENQLMLAMVNQEKKYLNEIKKLENKLKQQVEEQNREKQEWRKQLNDMHDSQQLIRQLEIDQNRKNRELEHKIKDLERKQQKENNNSNNNKSRSNGPGGFFGNMLGSLLGIPRINNDNNDSTCLIM